MMVDQRYLNLRSNRSIAQMVVVLAKAVPSWLFLVPLLGCQTLVVYVSRPVAWFAPPPYGVAEVKYESSLISAVGSLSNFNPNGVLVLVQGSLGLVWGSIYQLSSLKQWVIKARAISLAISSRQNQCSTQLFYGAMRINHQQTNANPQSQTTHHTHDSHHLNPKTRKMQRDTG